MRKSTHLIFAAALLIPAASFAQQPATSAASDTTQQSSESAKPHHRMRGGHEMGMEGMGDPQKMAEHRADMMAKRLNLNADQKQQVQSAFADEMQQMKSLHDSTKQKIESILNDDQKAKWKQMEDHEGHEGMGGGPQQMQRHLDMMAEKLNLTADQKSKAQELMQDAGQQAKAIHDDTSLSDEQRHEKMGDLHKSMMQKFEALLTPDQKAKLKEMHEQMRSKQGDGQWPGPPDDSNQQPQ